jgi:hypothetical protein
MNMPSHGTQFLICESCFWCASILTGGTLLGKCPCCKGSMLESIPIATGESYRFDYHIKRGVIL